MSPGHFAETIHLFEKGCWWPKDLEGAEGC
jgi:hypothetical protein